MVYNEPLENIFKSIYENTELKLLHKLANQNLLLDQKKLVKVVTKLFLYYLKEIKLPNSSLGICVGEFYLAGTQFIDNMGELIQSLNINDKVSLVHEKNNPYDKRAVKVQTTDNIKLGYIARTVFTLTF